MQRRAVLESYKVSLLQLPVSFFLLCANLCKVDEGLAMCFSEGEESVVVIIIMYRVTALWISHLP